MKFRELAFALLVLQQPQPVINAVRLEANERITVDGRLEEPFWERAEPGAGFIQQDPNHGAPATEPTEVRIAYDKDRLYIGVHCFDSNPSGMLGNQMVRDGFLSGDDRFMWVLDPQFNQRTGYFFEINPSGSMADALLVTPSGGVGGGGASQNRGWDGIWLARVRRHDRGWTAEIEIPFNTLNFDPNAPVWGANFQRTVRRKNEESFWSGWDRNQGLYHLASAGRVAGIRDVSQGIGVEVKPYIIGNYTDAPGRGITSQYKGTGGLDFFYNFTPLLKTNFTVNTDFAQTEVDDRQVNLTRFPLFFPEKRSFFLEGAGNFDFSREPAGDISAFFSRRIGLDENRRPQKIDWGLKLNGQAGHFDLGLMQVRTAMTPAAAGEDFTVFRPKLRFLRQSYAGAIYTRRATRATDAPDRHTIGADLELATTRFRGSQNLQFSGFMLKTRNPAKEGNDKAYGLRVNFPNDLWNARMSYRRIEANHDPAVGFVERTDIHRINPVARFGPRPKNNRWIRQVSMETWSEWLWDGRRDLIGRAFRFTILDLNLQSGDTAQIQISPTYEKLDRNFGIAPGINLRAGTDHQYTRYSFGFNTANRRVVSGNGNLTVGSFYTGHRRDLSAGLNLRPRRGVLATFNAQFNRIELPEGNFSTKILRAIVNTQLNPFVSISNNIQYDSVSRVLGWQFRFRWIVKPGNDVYVVLLNNWADLGDRFAVVDRYAATKLVYTHRF
ncbi:MAG: carbohydrate binding family 9 domain-containing protein [Acidobacteria bacterium]|nr:carbohydrate binding family 9 domain-containing protein [Acidobacteriota bacterium]